MKKISEFFWNKKEDKGERFTKLFLLTIFLLVSFIYIDDNILPFVLVHNFKDSTEFIIDKFCIIYTIVSLITYARRKASI